MTSVLFLPGGIAPAHVRYAALLAHLADVQTVLSDLDVYAADAPPPDYAIARELAAVTRAADAAGLTRFHLYAHSGGAAVALAYAAVHGERLLSLALDEPATDFSRADRDDPEMARILAAMALPDAEAFPKFVQLQLAEGVAPPARPDGPPPPWMAKRPAGIRAFVRAIGEHTIDEARLRAFRAPVYFSFGSLSNPRWSRMSDRLAATFPDFTSELYEGLHHMNTSHQAEPARVATTLRKLWARAEPG
jgi:pimeloyl-ACP methyl ester carboxylesterase